MRILILDDRQVDRRIAERTAEDFGEVRQAANLDEARGAIAGWHPSVVLADLHMQGRDPLEHFAAVMGLIDEQRTKLVAVTGDLNDTVLVRRFHERFPSVRLIAKDVRDIRDALHSLRVDESGRAVSVMDQNTPASHDQIMAVCAEYEARRLKDLGLTPYALESWVRERLACVHARERIAWTVGLSVLTLVAGTVLMFIAAATWRAFLMGPV